MSLHSAARCFTLRAKSDFKPPTCEFLRSEPLIVPVWFLAKMFENIIAHPCGSAISRFRWSRTQGLTFDWSLSEPVCRLPHRPSSLPPPTLRPYYIALQMIDACFCGKCTYASPSHCLRKNSERCFRMWNDINIHSFMNFKFSVDFFVVIVIIVNFAF